MTDAENEAGEAVRKADEVLRKYAWVDIFCEKWKELCQRKGKRSLLEILDDEYWSLEEIAKRIKRRKG
ncbi:MAG: hypothetical protein QW566_02465 [Candidatus Jordarchaeales archaeon]